MSKPIRVMGAKLDAAVNRIKTSPKGSLGYCGAVAFILNPTVQKLYQLSPDKVNSILKLGERK